MKINIKKYENVIFDNDGVLLDTNRHKEKNILKVVSRITGRREAEDFVRYFTQNNGIPREIKISKFFSPTKTENILREYNSLNRGTLVHAETTAGLVSFLAKLHSCKIKAYVLSGGDEAEIIYVLTQKGLLGHFKQVNGGPKTKEENFLDLNLKGPSLFIGDSQVDYSLAKQLGIDFVFMYGYTQFLSWQDFFKNIEGVTIIKDFHAFTINND